jgi:hypothetical protein
MCGFMKNRVGPRKSESQMAEGKKAEKNWAENEVFSIRPNLNRPNAQMAESRASGPPLARARFSPLALDSANFTV